MFLLLILIFVFGSSSTKQQQERKRDGIDFATLPEAGEAAFEKYLDTFATEAIDFSNPNGKSVDGTEYLVFEADNATGWRRDVKSAWCVLTTSQIMLKNGTDTHEFVVYVTNQDKWGAIGSKTEYKSAGCG